eukprot:1161455-Pelagomonas_calceolata.AAC.8
MDKIFGCARGARLQQRSISMAVSLQLQALLPPNTAHWQQLSQHLLYIIIVTYVVLDHRVSFPKQLSLKDDAISPKTPNASIDPVWIICKPAADPETLAFNCAMQTGSQENW